jgi:hypothetical protein
VRDSSPIVEALTAVNNESDKNGAGLFVTGTSSAPSLYDSILAYNAPYNLYVESSNSTSTVIRYNDLYSTGSNNHNLPALSSTNQLVEPGFLTYIDGLPYNLHLADTSPLVNQGNPATQDPDLTRSDMGMFAGSDADLWDLDQDGRPAYFWPGSWNDAPLGFDSEDFDCDDLDATIKDCD